MPVLPSTMGKNGMIIMPHIVGQVWPVGYLRPKPDFANNIHIHDHFMYVYESADGLSTIQNKIYLDMLNIINFIQHFVSLCHSCPRLP